MEVFFCKTEIYAGTGALHMLKYLAQGKVLVVCDPFFMESGKAKQVAELSGGEQVAYFSEVRPDPEVALAAKGAAAVKEFAPQTVLALGGGSTMDLAKAMVYFSGVEAKLIAIPTTSGSGSEVTDFAILTHEGVKHPLVDEKLRPYAAILDGELLGSLPKGLIADAGFDAISHAVEALVATRSGGITDALATEGFCMVYGNLGQSFGGNTRVRQTVHSGSCMAGLAFSQAGLGLCHAAAHALGGAFHIPHGRLNAILLPAVISLNAPVAGGKYAALSRNAGLGGAAENMGVRNLRNALIRLRRELKLPGTLAQAGVTAEMLRQQQEGLIKAILEDPCCATNPRPVDKELVLRLLNEVADGG